MERLARYLWGDVDSFNVLERGCGIEKQVLHPFDDGTMSWLPGEDAEGVGSRGGGQVGVSVSLVADATTVLQGHDHEEEDGTLERVVKRVQREGEEGGKLVGKVGNPIHRRVAALGRPCPKLGVNTRG